MTAPLSAIKVIEIGTLIAAPFAARMLAEFGADVLIENLRPGALEKLGLGWDVLHALNPNLTLVRISGYGQTGPYRDRPGFGAIGEAMGGIRYTTGTPGSPPGRSALSSMSRA